MKLTAEQQQIIKADFSDLLLINAYAGTGKTTTLVKFCEARLNDKILYMAYNKSMAQEAAQKFAHLPNVDVMTIHALAFRKIGATYKRRLGTLRAMDMLPFCDDVDEEEQYYYAYLLLNLIRDFCNKSYSMSEYLMRLSRRAAQFRFENQADVRYFINRLPEVWERLQADDEFAYEHNFYLKKYQLSKPILRYDYILIDEAQDVNGCIIDIVIRQKAKKVFVGDAYQSIYQFRGAVNSFEELSKIKNATTLYLTKSFRCPTNVAEIANQYLYLLNAPKPFKGIPIKQNIASTQTTVISRTNAKLFDYAVKNIKKKFYFVGGIDSYNFQDLIDIQKLRYKEKDYIKNGFIRRFANLSELEKYANDANEIDLKIKISIVDKYSYKDINNLIRKIRNNTVQNSDEAQLILTTAHKAKGAEWKKVKLLDDFVNVKKEIEKSEDDERATIERDELNLLYVAITRTQQQLLIDDDYILEKDFIKRFKDFITVD